MKNISWFFLSLIAVSFNVLAHDGHDKSKHSGQSLNWTSFSFLSTKFSRDKNIYLEVEENNGAFDSVFLQNPQFINMSQLKKENNKWVASKEQIGSGGHLWITALREKDNLIVRANTYYFFPAKHDVPTRMLEMARNGLEIIPLRLPEHGGVREGSRWSFMIRHNNIPLKKQKIFLQTETRTQTQFLSDENGLVEITFPHDFAKEKLGGNRPRQAFILSTYYSDQDKDYLTTYNHYYYPDLMRSRNLEAGIAVFALGMILATPLLRRKEKKNA